MATTKTVTGEKYYAKFPASANHDDHCDLYFWFSRTACRGIPSDYGWSPRPGDVEHGYLDKDTLLRWLTNTMALEIDRGNWTLEEVAAIEIHKVSETVVTTSDDEIDESVKHIEDAIFEIGSEQYGWT